MIALVIIIAVICLIAITPVGGRALYDSEGFFAWIKFGFLNVRIIPIKAGKTKKTKKKKQKEKSTKEPKEAAKTGGSIEQLKSFLPLVKQALGYLKKGLVVNNITVYYLAAADDAASAAIQYGIGWAAAGNIMALFEGCRNIKKSDVQVFVDFNEEASPKVYADVTVTIRIWRMVYMAVALAVSFIKILKNNKQKVANKDGTSDK